jgi:hypothetical protein
MALLSFVESAPRAYRLKASNAASPISTSSGTIPVHVSDTMLGKHYRQRLAVKLGVSARARDGANVDNNLNFFSQQHRNELTNQVSGMANCKVRNHIPCPWAQKTQQNSSTLKCRGGLKLIVSAR